MRTSLLLYSVLLTGRLVAQQPVAPPSLQVFHVLEEKTVPQNDGGSVTFKRVDPPAAVLPPAPLPAPVLTPAELARQQELEGKTGVVLRLSASVHDQSLTVVRWNCDGSQTLQAVCNVNFHHLAGLGRVETAQSLYSVVMGLGTAADELAPEAALAAQYLPADGTPSFVLFQGPEPVNLEDEPALKARVALQALLD